jgi:inosine-uridine nucleoside N-ribohydrolase
MRAVGQRWFEFATLVILVALLVGAALSQTQAPRELIVDVGGAPEDFLALAALLRLDSGANARVRIVTVHGNSGVSIDTALTNVREFVAMLGFTADVIVAPGASASWADLPERWNANASDPLGSTTTRILHRPAAMLPTCRASPANAPFTPVAGSETFIRPASFGGDTYTTYAVESMFGAADALPVSSSAAFQDSTDSAVVAVASLLASTTIDVEYIALGTLTNLAEVLRAAPAASLRRLRALHVYGGSVVARGDLGKWVDEASLAGTSLEGTRVRSTVTWSMFVDPVAANFALSFQLPLGCSRYVYPRDVTDSVRVRYSSTFGTYSPVFGGLTLGAVAAASALRSQGVRGSAAEAAVLEFIAALTEAHHRFTDVSGATNSAFDRTYFSPGATFVAMAAANPAVRSQSLPVPRDRRLSVAADGTLSSAATGSIPTADESLLYDSAATARGVDAFFDELLSTLRLSRWSGSA